jgi:hypothetical protein
MKSTEIKPEQPEVDSWYLEDDLSGIDQPKKEEIQKVCKHFNLPFTKECAYAIIYGGNRMLPERVPPIWLKELE